MWKHTGMVSPQTLCLDMTTVCPNNSVMRALVNVRQQKEQEQRIQFEQEESLRQAERERIKQEIERNKVNVDRRQVLLQEKDMETRKKEVHYVSRSVIS